MSKTFGHTKSQRTHSVGRKSRAYVKDRDRSAGKDVVEMGDATGITRLGKLITRNSNRSKKKGRRQELSKMMYKQFNEDNRYE